jgi:hypothetical protein
MSNIGIDFSPGGVAQWTSHPPGEVQTWVRFPPRKRSKGRRRRENNQVCKVAIIYQRQAVVNVEDLRLGPVELVHLVEVAVNVGDLGVVEKLLKKGSTFHCRNVEKNMKLSNSFYPS